MENLNITQNNVYNLMHRKVSFLVSVNSTQTRSNFSPGVTLLCIGAHRDLRGVLISVSLFSRGRSLRGSCSYSMIYRFLHTTEIFMQAMSSGTTKIHLVLQAALHNMEPQTRIAGQLSLLCLCVTLQFANDLHKKQLLSINNFGITC